MRVLCVCSDLVSSVECRKVEVNSRVQGLGSRNSSEVSCAFHMEAALANGTMTGIRGIGVLRLLKGSNLAGSFSFIGGRYCRPVRWQRLGQKCLVFRHQREHQSWSNRSLSSLENGPNRSPVLVQIRSVVPGIVSCRDQTGQDRNVCSTPRCLYVGVDDLRIVVAIER